MLKFAALATLFACANALCPGQERRPQLPRDPAARGPWPVGTVIVDNITERNLTFELFYPGRMGSEAGREPETYDVRQYLPDQDKDRIPDDDAPIQFGTGFNGLPLDETRGRFPVIIFIHGTAGWAGQSLQQVEHWASRGFVVASATYPGINLRDLLKLTYLEPIPNTNQAGDARLIHQELTTLRDPRLRFLDGFIDIAQLGMGGHSAGAGALLGFGDVAKVLVPMATRFGVLPGAALESVVVIGGGQDGVTGGIASTEAAFNGSPSPKRAAVQRDIGHLFCTDLCTMRADAGGIVGLATRYGMWQGPLFAPLGTDGCQYANPRFIDPEEGWYFTNFMSAAAFEETLLCEPEMAEVFPEIKDYEFIEAYFEDLN